MAKAYDLLDAEGRADPSCVRCHVVGLGQPGGFSLGQDPASDRARLLGVGCESCHGAAKAYLGDGLMDKDYEEARDARLPQLEAHGYIPSPGEDVCLRCHNADSPHFESFDYEAQRETGLHGH